MLGYLSVFLFTWVLIQDCSQTIAFNSTNLLKTSDLLAALTLGKFLLRHTMMIPKSKLGDIFNKSIKKFLHNINTHMSKTFMPNFKCI